jgi:two-component system, OmpR family, sensor histidine kinase QseC
MNTPPKAASPSLMWRVARHLLIGFVLVYFVLLASLLYSGLRRESGELDKELLRFSKTLVASLETEATVNGQSSILAFVHKAVEAEEAATLGGLTSQLQPFVYAGTVDKSILNKNKNAPSVDIFSVSEGVSTFAIGTKNYRAYASSSKRWRVLILDDTNARVFSVLTDIALELALYVSIAGAIILGVTLITVRTVLNPLKLIASHILKHEPHDTRPISLPVAYRELHPVLDALNRLFLRVATSIDREKSFVQDAAHELRTPLAVIAAQAHVLAHSEDAERDAAKRQMENAVARASHLTQQLLHVARASAEIPVEHQQIDLMNTIRDGLAAFSEQAASRKTELSLHGPDNLIIRSDPQRLRSILDNLIDNALRYGTSPGGAINVTVCATLTTFEMKVCDSGPGIPVHWREQAFERFWRAPDAIERGAGLGLAIVRESVLALNGRVEILQPESGVGCMVVVTFPVLAFPNHD